METTSTTTTIYDNKPLTAIIKRTIDVIGSIIAIIFTFPLMILIAILIKIDSEGPVLYIQERFGKDGRIFKIYKFRSMVKDAESRLGELINLDELEEPVFKIKDDPRVTSVGRILRRTRFDEIPQFFNVLKGEMSLVGPRPEEVQMAKRYNPWQRTRLLMKPGITGPVQISGIGDMPLNERVVLEEDYIKNYSLKRDIVILIKTIPAILGSTKYIHS
jgi:lipopolysaccharide/colanic/teichoic acid biosynthesis glycosyltransferase